MPLSSPRLKDALELELILMSWHESSHAVVALCNNFEVCFVSVRNPTEKDGKTEFRTTADDVKDPELHRVLIINELEAMYAGLIGERLLYRELCGTTKYPRHLQIGLSYDIKLASQIIRRHELAPPGKETALFKKNIHRKVEKILLDHWGSVKLIAHTLHKKRKISSFEELRLLLTRKSNEKEFWRDKLSKIKLIYGAYDDNENEQPTDEFIKKVLIY
jgi:hypothetical protein